VPGISSGRARRRVAGDAVAGGPEPLRPP